MVFLALAAIPFLSGLAEKDRAGANRMGQPWGTLRAAFAYTEIGETWSTRLT